MKKRARLQTKTSGFVPVVKPKGMTSSQVVQRVKKSLNLSRAGHSGTLDPMATGLLIVLANGATKMLPFMKEWGKEYVAVARLGMTTDTDDIEGKTVGSVDISPLDRETVRDALENFKGELLQTPPLYSAKKFNGRPHYEYARKGIEVERKASKVHVKEIELLKYDHPDLTFKVLCSPGTYIRSICRDLGAALGCGAAMADLERTKNGPFNVEDAFEIDELVEENAKFILKIEPENFGLKALVLSRTAENIAERGGTVFKRDFSEVSSGMLLEKGKDYLAFDECKNALGIFECIMGGALDRVSGSEPVFRAKRVFV